jgi:hypothetical protein
MADKNSRKSLEGIRGWLLLWLIASTVSFIYLVLSIKLDMVSGEIWRKATAPGAEYYHPLCKPFLIYEFILQFVNPFAILALMVLCLTKRRMFPTFAIGFYIVNFVLVLVDVGTSSRITFDLGLNLALPRQALFGSLFGVFIWSPYFIRSKRVKATFVT